MKWMGKQKTGINLHNSCVFAVLLLTTGLHILSWNSKAFTDWYRLRLFPVLTGIPARISDLFSGSVGEILIAAGVLVAVLELFLVPVLAWKTRQGNTHKPDAKAAGIKKWNLRFACWVLVYIYVTETLNCYMLYHASTVEEQYYSTGGEQGTELLVRAYSEVVAKANALAGQVKRDAKGRAVFDGTDAQLYEKCRQAMRKQGEVYPYLSGYYPDPKPIRASHFMSQQYLLGIYFPFTMEANYNTVMYPVNMPATICHEYSHLKGIILEDEANYFGFAACIESDDPYLQYSGYLSVIGYLSRQVRESVPQEIRKDMEQASGQVIQDDVFLTEEQWERVEEKAVLPTETVNKAANAFLETNLTMNGVKDGIKSYSRVVRLVLKYYESQDSGGVFQKVHDKIHKK